MIIFGSVITFFTAGVGVTTLPLKIYSMIKVAVTPEVNAVSTLLMALTLTLIVDHAEDVDLHLPMVSRVLHLLMIDIVTVSMAMQRQESLAPPAGSEMDELRLEPRARTVAPGVSAAAPLANITSHSH